MHATGTHPFDRRPPTLSWSRWPGSELDANAAWGEEQLACVAERELGGVGGAVVVEQLAEEVGHFFGGGGVEEPVDVAGIFDFEALGCGEAFAKLVGLGHEQGADAGDVHRHASDVIRFEGEDLKGIVVDHRSFQAETLAGAGLSVFAGQAGGPSAAGRCQSLGDDEVDRHDDLVVEADPGEAGLPDPGLAGQHVGDRGERLVTDEPAFGSQVHGLSAHQHQGREVWLVFRLRTDAGLTQPQMAERMGTTQSAIARMEGGGSRPSLDTPEKLATAAGADLVIGVGENLSANRSIAKLERDGHAVIRRAS
ncbi:MAG: putative transcriptional regulator [Acidimicrobiales bacterium]|nr:putative transcriptional regulator [Acidimicrobiales bacterium]